MSEQKNVTPYHKTTPENRPSAPQNKAFFGETLIAEASRPGVQSSNCRMESAVQGF